MNDFNENKKIDTDANSTINDLFDKAESVSLSVAEKSRMREHLMRYMSQSLSLSQVVQTKDYIKKEVDEFKPVLQSEKNREVEPRVQSPFFKNLMGTIGSYVYTYPHKKSLLVAFIVVFVLTSGVSFAARGALPGDVLYPIKISFNEKVESLLSVTPRAIAVTKASHIVNRLKEVETLASDKKLDVSAQMQAKVQLDEDAEKVVSTIEKLHTSGDGVVAQQVSSDLKNSLENHQVILAQLSESPENYNERELISDFAGSISVQIAHLSRTEARLNGESGEGRDEADTFSATRVVGDIGSTSIATSTAKMASPTSRTAKESVRGLIGTSTQNIASSTTASSTLKSKDKKGR